MPRPYKKRRVCGKPNSSYFKPIGIKLKDLEKTTLTLPEFEAIRLIDQKNMSQEQAGNQMQVSQATLSRIIKSAHEKIADALVNGKAIEVKNE